MVQLIARTYPALIEGVTKEEYAKINTVGWANNARGIYNGEFAIDVKYNASRKAIGIFLEKAVESVSNTKAKLVVSPRDLQGKSLDVFYYLDSNLRADLQNIRLQNEGWKE